MPEAPATVSVVDQLIEKFGGLRPMAKALDVPVPTVQGWKKRGRVPSEHHAVLQAQAALQGWSADLAVIMAVDKSIQVKTQNNVQASIQPAKPVITPPKLPQAKPISPDYMQAMLGTPHQSTSYWVWLGLASIAGVIAALLILMILFFAPDLSGWLWPAATATHTATNTPTEQWLARLDTLETQLDALNDNDHARANALEALQKTRMQLTAHSPEAADSIKDLQKQMQALQGQISVLNQQKQDTSLLQKMAASDTRAATLLLATTKLQQIFQGQGSFVETLPQLQALLADYPNLQAALAKIAPYAATGLPKTSHIQADIRHQALAYSQAQSQPATANQPIWLAQLSHVTQQFVTVKKNDKTLIGGEESVLPQAVPEALEALEHNDYTQSLQKLHSLPQNWQQTLGQSIKDVEGRMAAQDLLNQVWHASAKLVKQAAE